MGDTACFFVDDKTVADALKSKSHRITCRDGSKVFGVSMNYILNLSRGTKKHVVPQIQSKFHGGAQLD